MKSKINQQMLDAMHKDLGNWRGPFYFNSKDPRFSVPKYNPSLGWTLNFANPITYLVIIAFVLVMVTVSLL